MTQIKKSRLSKGLAASALAFALAAAAGSLVPAEDAMALPAYSKTTTYYADAAKTSPVGFHELTCTGDQISFGSTSSYKTVVYEACP